MRKEVRLQEERSISVNPEDLAVDFLEGCKIHLYEVKNSYNSGTEAVLTR
jgi:hypothetical protein